MRPNRSPWLHQLDPSREIIRLSADLKTDVAIVGAGIAGVSSAFFTLKYTDKKVVLLERFKLGHGASGHNAGQVVSYFERGFASLVEEFGLELAAKGQQAIEDAWELIDEMYTEAGLTIPFEKFKGRAGYTSFEQVLWHLKDSEARVRAGLKIEKLEISEDAVFLSSIPPEYEGLYELVASTYIAQTLETDAPSFVAVATSKKGCVNSALFCQEVVRYLLERYPERFALYEHALVHKLLLREGHAILDVDTHVVEAARVVLCTNGFEDLHIINENGLGIDARYHHLVAGSVGYMAAYLMPQGKQPTAIGYYIDPKPGLDNKYFYLTRRTYEYEKGNPCNLVAIGGPENPLLEYLPYKYEGWYPDGVLEAIDAFVRSIYDLGAGKAKEYIFTWRGLMGYTTNGVRLVCVEPQNPVLLYNLGCNGVGILPSVYGGRKIARHLGGEQVEKTIFEMPKRSAVDVLDELAVYLKG